MSDHWDPVDEIEQPTLAERVEPYRKYGDAELAVTLWRFEKCYGGAGIPSPALRGFDWYCSDCGENVRGVSLPDQNGPHCPLCGEIPGFLALGRGPR